MPTPRPALLSSIHSLTSAFSSNASTAVILSHFTSTPTPLVHEHGSPLLQSALPFIGRDFTGLSGVSEYFDILAQYLSYSDMTFDDEDDWVVDAQYLTICLRGQARFTYKATGESWLETFMWRIILAEDLTSQSEVDANQGLKVQEYRVWSDTGAAFLASRGELQSPGKGVGIDGTARKSIPAAAKGDDVLGADYPPKDKLGSGLAFGGSSG